MPKINSKNLIPIIIISFVLISSNIGGLYIYALDEAKNSVCAIEMMDRGDLIVPTFNDSLRTDKPPLHYYFMQLGYFLFGVNAFAARFFSVIMGVLTILVTWWGAQRYYGDRAALYTAIALMASLHFTLQFHMAVPDPYLVFLLTLGFITFYVNYKEDKPVYLIISYLSFGLGTLAKGPIAIALPGLAILLFLILVKKLNWNYIKNLKIYWALAVLVLVVAPWYILVAIKTDGQWINDFFLKHNVGRYTDPMEGHGAIFLVTPFIALTGMIPFSIFIFQSIKYSWGQRKNKDLGLYALVISLTIILFFSFSSTKLPNYTVPAYPLLALLIGRYLDFLQDNFKKVKLSIKTSLWIYVFIAMALPAGIYFWLIEDPVLMHLKNLSIYFLILPIGAWMALILIYFSQYKGMILSLALSWIVISLLFFYVIFPKIDNYNPIAQILPVIEPGQQIVAYKFYNPPFSFYIRKHIPVLNSADELQHYLSNNHSGYVLTRKELENEIIQLEGLTKIAEAKDIFEPPTSVVFEFK